MRMSISAPLSQVILSLPFAILPLTFFLAIGLGPVNALSPNSNNAPIIKDSNLKVEVVFKGIKFPTTMAFLGPNDILVLEKNNGTVQRIVNGTMLLNPLLDVNVAAQTERGMLGIAVSKLSCTNGRPTYVFLYFTQAKTKDSEGTSNENDVLGNRLYRYELVNNKLVNPKLILDVPSPKPLHNGGKLILGPDNNIYLVAGDGGKYWGNSTQAHNNKNGTYPDGTSAIYRITQDGKPVEPTIFGGKDPLDKYYAYGIRNSFGLDFDPVTGNLWDTENGPGFGDEINLVEPGFNSGWGKIQGIWERSPLDPSHAGKIASPKREGLVDFHGKGNYSSPEFIWNHTVGVTSLKFFNSDKLGKEYENDLFVSDFHHGYLYHFDLNKKRNELLLNGPLHDKIADKYEDLQNITLGQGFGGITDMEVGYDGYLYILSLQQGGGDCEALSSSRDCIKYSSPVVGTIYKIVPES
jgi:glucose/arabinose dehydrogenase